MSSHWPKAADERTPVEPERNMWSPVSVVLALAALIVASIAVVQGDGADGPPAKAELGAVTPASSTLEVSLTEFAIDPDELKVPAGDVTIRVTNDGAVPHTLAFDQGKPVTPQIGAGETVELELGALKPGIYKLFCDVPGHEGAGMTAQLTVTEADAAAGGQGAGGGAVDYAALDRAMEDSIKRFPAETKGLGAQRLEPEILGDGTKEFRLTAEIVDWEVEPGKTVKAWTYNGQVPAPTIKVDVGDKLRVVVTNDLPMGTDVHWHGVRVPNDQDGVAPITQELIRPGTTFTYEFTAQEPTIGMYHPHHHAQMQVVNGMLGMIQIGDVALPAGRTIGGRAVAAGLNVTQEFPMVLNDAGVLGYSLNGKSFPATAPIVANQGEWLLVHYLNEGLQIHPMHPHGAPQLVVAKEGIALDSPYWADTLTVAPGERYSVLIEARDVGTWAWHCHVLTHVEGDDGMFGMVTAIIVK